MVPTSEERFVENKRIFKRRELLYNLTLYDAETRDLVGYIVDINDQGLKFTGSNRYATGRHLDLAIELPEEIFSRKTIKLSATVKWCGPDSNPDLCATGLQITTLSPDDHEALIGLMTQYSMLI
jgi:hypothetical protein